MGDQFEFCHTYLLASGPCTKMKSKIGHSANLQPAAAVCAQVVSNIGSIVLDSKWTA